MRAIRAAQAGEFYVDPSLSSTIVLEEGDRTLSARQREILQMLANGLQTEAVARQLGPVDRDRAHPHQAHPGQARGVHAHAGRGHRPALRPDSVGRSASGRRRRPAAPPLDASVRSGFDRLAQRHRLARPPWRGTSPGRRPPAASRRRRRARGRRPRRSRRPRRGRRRRSPVSPPPRRPGARPAGARPRRSGWAPARRTRRRRCGRACPPRGSCGAWPAPTCTSTRSPAGWPWPSLTRLRPSTSITSSANGCS